MPTGAEIRAAADAWLAPRWTTIQSKEADYLAAHGRYFQGKWTHMISIPSDGDEAAPDNLNDRPTDQAEKWADLVTLPATMPCALSLDVYDGPQGMGYVGTVLVRINGNRWVRRAQVGPETWRAFNWVQP